MEVITNTHAYTEKGLKGLQKKDEDTFTQRLDYESNEKIQINKTESSFKTVKQQLNQSILKSSLAVSVSAGNEPMALLYKAAIDGINEALKGEFGENAIQNAYDSGLDVSPEATAKRIVSMSTGFFSQFQAQNPEMSDEQAAKSFVQIIEGGIDTGFEDAKNILGGLDVLEGDIASSIEITYDLVQQGLQDFIDSFVKTEEKVSGKD